MGRIDLFTVIKIEDNITRIADIAGVLMYLIEGEDKAALIDTGSGVGDLKKFVETLTNKPIVVILTHGHVDHAMGASLFDEVYMSSKDNDVFDNNKSLSNRKDYIEMNNSHAEQILNEEDYIDSNREKFKELKDGDKFDLGGVTLVIYESAGHTHGSISVLIKEKRIMLLGDSCNIFTFLWSEESLGLTTYEKNLLKLKEKTDGLYDKVYLSHGGGDVDKDIINGVIQVCKDIKQGDVDDIPFKFPCKFMDSTDVYIAKAVDFSKGGRADGGLGNIVYKKERIYK